MDKAYFNKNVECGQFPMNRPGSPEEQLVQGSGCGSRDWKIYKRKGTDVNVRILVCQKCGLETAVFYFAHNQDDDDFGKTPSHMQH